MDIRAIVSVVLFATLLSACGSEQVSGNRSLSRENIASIRNGETSKNQVRALLGAPQAVKTQMPIVLPSGVQPLPAKLTASEIWAYWIDRKSTPGLVTRLASKAKPRHSSLTLIIYFDGNGTVLGSEIEEGQL